MPAPLQVTMKGESLFNDGVGSVLFFVEALGGALLGLGTGYLAYRAMYAIDEYGVEVLISLALVTGTYALAQRLGLSGPIAVVVAGLLIGNRGTRFAMSGRT